MSNPPEKMLCVKTKRTRTNLGDCGKANDTSTHAGHTATCLKIHLKFWYSNCASNVCCGPENPWTPQIKKGSKCIAGNSGALIHNTN